MKPWNPSGIEGVHRFLKKTWRTLLEPDGKPSEKIARGGIAEDAQLLKQLHETIRKVTRDIENLRLNTAISQMMIFINGLAKAPSFTRETALSFVQLLAPFAPHIAEELWARLGQSPSVAAAPWPEADASLLVQDQVRYMVQVNGKLRGELELPKETRKDEVLAHAKKIEKVASFLDGKTVRKEVFVPGKIVNFVV